MESQPKSPDPSTVSPHKQFLQPMALGVFLKSVVGIGALKLVGALPMRYAQALGSAAGKVAYRLNTRMATTTRQNIQACYPELSNPEIEAYCRRSLEETGKLGFETCGIWCRPKPLSHYVVGIQNESLVKDALSAGKGVLLLAPHLGNWEILGQYLGSVGHITAMYQPAKLPAFDSIIRASRINIGTALVPTNARGVAGMVKTLRAGNIAGLLPDQQPKDSSGAGAVFAPFFGHPALTMTLAGGLIQKSGCTALFGFAKRVPKGFELIFHPAPKALYDPDPQVAAAALNRGIENLVAEAPEQYQWEYKRFRATPDKSQNIYRDT